MRNADELDRYAAEAERFAESINREYLLHLSGRKAELDVASVYAAHRNLFRRDSVVRLVELSGALRGQAQRRCRYLAHFAVDGLLGEATKSEAEEAARLEASLEVELDGYAVPYRQVPVEQANAANATRRESLEAARNELLSERLVPIQRRALERAQALCRELGWPSYAAGYAELRGIDFARLLTRTEELLAATESIYATTLEPELERSGLPGFGTLRRSDMPRFFRAPSLDAGFPAERLVPSFAETLRGLGMSLEAQANVHLDIESRPTKSPRAFCAAPRVPEEVHLVISPVGGRDDFAALFHEGGHVEHYASAERELPFEFRQLGDNAVTESFAFLFEHLTADPAWLERRLVTADVEAVASHARAVRLMMLRRYCAKLAYELELHGPGADLDGMPDRYSSLLGGAVRVEWPTASWLADVDEGFYVVCYLRAWALESLWRRSLRERFGERWFEKEEAGAWLRGLWAKGQKLSAEELASAELGEELEFGTLATELTSAAAPARGRG